MKVIIVGAGSVGLAVAEEASRGNDVLVVDRDPARTEAARTTLQVSVLNDDGSNPRVLGEAIRSFGADIVFACVPDDGINLFICGTAKRVSKSVKTVACLRSPDYASDEASAGADRVVSPISISTDRIAECAIMESLVSFMRTGVGDLCLATFRIDPGSAIVGKTVMALHMPEGCAVVYIVRRDETILQTATAEIGAGDRVVTLGTQAAVEEFNRIVGSGREAKEFAILGASQLARSVAKAIDAFPGKQYIRIADDDLDACREASREIKDAIVVNGSTIDPVFLRSESIDKSDVIVCLPGTDERNLLASMTSMRFGVRKIITNYSTDDYEAIFKFAGIESVFGYHRVIINEVSKILADFSGDEGEGVITMDDPRDHFFGFRVGRDSPICGEFLGDLVLPEGMSIPALVRGSRVVLTGMGTKFEDRDLALVCTHMIDDYRLATALGKRAPELRRCSRSSGGGWPSSSAGRAARSRCSA